MSKLSEEMERRMRLRGLSPKTIKTYIAEVRQFTRYYGKSPDFLGDTEVQNYLSHLIEKRKLSRGKVICAHAGLRFFFEKTLERPWNTLKIPNMKKSKKLPVVLSKEKIYRIFSQVKNHKHLNILQLAYSSGLRISETLNLRIESIDSSRMVIHVHGGKGQKDRLTVLSQKALDDLRIYWKKEKPANYLFPGRYGENKPLSTRRLQDSFQKACRAAGVLEHATPHSLRHSFAVHLLESGCDILQIQQLLGHTTLATTIKYLRVRSFEAYQFKNPFDHD